MKTLRGLIATLTVCLLAGCYTTGLSPREQGVSSFSDLVYGLCAEPDVSENPRAPLDLPIRLGVAQIGEAVPAQALLSELKQYPGIIAEVTEIPLAGDIPPAYGPSGIETRQQALEQKANRLRKLGEQVGTDYVLLVGGNIDSYTTSHPVQVLDLAILPGVLIKSQTLHMDARAAGALVNTKTGIVRTLVSATSHADKCHPSFYEKQTRTQLALEQRDKLSKQLAQELIKKLCP